MGIDHDSIVQYNTMWHSAFKRRKKYMFLWCLSFIYVHIFPASLPARSCCCYGILCWFKVIRSFPGLPNLTTYVKPCATSAGVWCSILYINGLSQWQLTSNKLSTNLGQLQNYLQLLISTPVLHASLHVLNLTSLPAEIYCRYGIQDWF